MNDELDDNIKDRLVSATKAATSLVPFLGGPLGEVIGEIIPNLRQDRIVKYIRKLEHRLSSLETTQISDALASPVKIDLIETGGYQAARAISNERISQITKAVFNGIEAPETDVMRKKRLLNLLAELDDDEVSILHAYGQSYGGRGREAWLEIERPSPSHLGASREILDQNALYNAGKDHLYRLGLLKKRFSSLKKGEYPEFDKQSGQFKGSDEISSLGRLLLREIGLPSAVDQARERR